MRAKKYVSNKVTHPKDYVGKWLQFPLGGKFYLFNIADNFDEDRYIKGSYVHFKGFSIDADISDDALWRSIDKPILNPRKMNYRAIKTIFEKGEKVATY